MTAALENREPFLGIVNDAGMVSGAMIRVRQMQAAKLPAGLWYFTDLVHRRMHHLGREGHYPECNVEEVRDALIAVFRRRLAEQEGAR